MMTWTVENINTCFRPLAGCGLFLRLRNGFPSSGKEFPSPCGVWVVSFAGSCFLRGGVFPSPCGVWVVSLECLEILMEKLVSVPLRGVGCFRALLHPVPYRRGVSVPLRGVGCFPRCAGVKAQRLFPSPCGVWVVSAISDARPASIQSFRPLAGCGLFRRGVFTRLGAERFRPLAGCGLFLLPLLSPLITLSFRPLAGCGLFHRVRSESAPPHRFRPLAGCGLFQG